MPITYLDEEKIIPKKRKITYLEEITPEMFGEIGKTFTRPISRFLPERFQPTKFLPEQIRTPVEAAQTELERGLGRGITSGINVAALNIPQVAFKKAGMDILPKAKTPMETVADIAGGTAGAVTGAPGQIYRGITSAKRLAQIPRLLRVALGGAATGGAYTPEGGLFAPKERAKQAAIAAPSAVALDVGARAIRDLWTLSRAKGQAGLYQKVRDTIIGKVREAGNTFEKGLEDLVVKNPKTKIDLSQQARYWKALQTASPEARDDELLRIIKSSKTLSILLKNPKLAENLNAVEIQKAINEIKLPIRVGKLGTQPSDLARLDLKNSLRDAQLEAYPEMAKVRAAYREIIQPFREIRNYLQIGKTGIGITARSGEIAGKGGIFGKDVEFELKELPKLLPKNLIEQLGGFRGANNLVRAFGRLLSAGIIGGSVFYGVRRGLGELSGGGGTSDVD